MSLTIEKWPGGIKTSSGGTRTSVKLSRSWQPDIGTIINPEKCPFEKPKEEEIISRHFNEKWLVLENIRTPFSFHRLIIPNKCLKKEKLLVLGGLDCIDIALCIAFDIVHDQHQRELWLGVHIGPLAGQNVGHMHYHLLTPHNGKSSDNEVKLIDNPSLFLSDGSNFKVVAGGNRVGQCFILPKDNIFLVEDLATTIHSIITLYAERFKSTQGMPPDYMIGIKFLEGKMVYGYYVPVLTQWGFTEHFGLMENTPLILPWPHIETVKHLKS